MASGRHPDAVTLMEVMRAERLQPGQAALQATLQAVLSGPAGTTPSEPTRRLLQLLQELHGGPASGRAPPTYVSPQVSNGIANGSVSNGSPQPPPGLGHAQLSAPPGLGSCLGGGGGGGGGGGSVERANVTYSTPETTELQPAAVVGLGLREAEGGLGLEGDGEEEEVIDNYDDLAKLPSFFSNMNGDDDDALE